MMTQYVSQVVSAQGVEIIAGSVEITQKKM